MISTFRVPSEATHGNHVSYFPFSHPAFVSTSGKTQQPQAGELAMSRTSLSLSVVSLLAMSALALPAYADPLTIYEIAILSSPTPNSQWYADATSGNCTVPVTTYPATQNPSNLMGSTGNQVIFSNGTSTTYSGTVSYNLYISAYINNPSARITWPIGSTTSLSGTDTVTLEPNQYTHYDASLSGNARFSCPTGTSAYTAHASSYVYGTFPGGPTGQPGTFLVSFTVNPPQ